MADLFNTIGGAAGDIFGAIGSFDEAKGYKASAQAYGQAAVIADQNKQITAESTGIQLAQATRQITQVTGAQQAQVGAAGLAQSGGAQDLLRSSLQQGALTKGLVSLQGAINENAYQAEADAARGQAAAAEAAASAKKASGIGGIVSGIAKVASFFISDVRAKGDVRLHYRMANGVGIYSYNYLGSKDRFLGYIAQDVARIIPDAVEYDEPTGFYKVNYAMVDPLMPVPVYIGKV